MAYSDEEKKEELERLVDFLDSVEIAAQVISKGVYAEDVSLLISLPTIEDQDGVTEENAHELLHLATANLVDFDDPQQQVVKYLSLYAQVKADFAGVDEADILRLLNEMNRSVRVGHFFYGGEEEVQNQVQYRAAVMGGADEYLDEGVVANVILEMGVGYDMMKDALEELAEKAR